MAEGAPAEENRAVAPPSEPARVDSDAELAFLCLCPSVMSSSQSAVGRIVVDCGVGLHGVGGMGLAPNRVVSGQPRPSRFAMVGGMGGARPFRQARSDVISLSHSAKTCPHLRLHQQH